MNYRNSKTMNRTSAQHRASRRYSLAITPLAATPTRHVSHTHTLPRNVSKSTVACNSHSVDVDGLDHGSLGLLGGHEGGLGGRADGGLGGGLEAKGRGAGGQDAEGGGELHGCFDWRMQAENGECQPHDL